MSAAEQDENRALRRLAVPFFPDRPDDAFKPALGVPASFERRFEVRLALRKWIEACEAAEAAGPQIEVDGASAAHVDQGRQLLHAFMRITDPSLRQELLRLALIMAEPSENADCREH